MASVGHIAVGMAAARIYRDGRVPGWSSMAAWSALSLLPDVDVIGFALGVDYGDPWGHRGATHSLTMSVALGLTIGLSAHWFKRRAIRTGLVASMVLASHGVLDTMTDGGLGSALFWPFSLTRYFAPWRPIPVAPIGLDYFSPYGVIVALIELVLFSPLMVFALRSRRLAAKSAALLLVPWVVSVWLTRSDSPVRDAIEGYLSRRDTAYASGFSEKAFRAVTPGESESEVRHLLGAPFRESWFYTPKGQPFKPAISRSAASLTQACLIVRFESGGVARTLALDACTKVGVNTGMSPTEVDRRLGAPPESCLEYSWSPSDAYYRMRVVCFVDGKVSTLLRQWQH